MRIIRTWNYHDPELGNYFTGESSTEVLNYIRKKGGNISDSAYINISDIQLGQVEQITNVKEWRNQHE